MLAPSDESQSLESFKNYTELFEYCFPIYLSYGMTYEQYWHGEARLVKFYAKAQEIVYNRRENELWKLGVYFMRANASLWDKDAHYPEEPLFKIETERDLQLKENRKLQSMKAFWETVAADHNAKLKQQGSKQE